MSARRSGGALPLWWVYPVDGSRSRGLFCGSREQMVEHIAGLHRLHGRQYGGREVEQRA